MFGKIIKSFIPPVIPYLYLKFFSSGKNSLFGGDDFLFKKSIDGIKIYGEYGCGQSSKWILDNTSSKVISVDSSKEWVQKVKKENKKHKSRLIINHVNLGKVGSWGRPISYEKSYKFSDYTDYIWKQKEKPKIKKIDLAHNILYNSENIEGEEALNDIMNLLFLKALGPIISDKNENGKIDLFSKEYYEYDDEDDLDKTFS